jgi:ribosome-binding factor A
MESIRQQKVGRLIQKAVSEIFNKSEVRLLSNTMVSITTVRMTPDMGLARVYVSLFPTEKKTEAIEQLRQQQSEVRYLLGKKIGKQVRHIPELQFYLDDSFDYAEEIDQLLKKP